MTQLHRLNNVTTLLVDGDLMIRNSLSLAFKVSRSFLQTARTGEEALPEIEKKHFDIILFDFNLPKMEGLDFFKKANKINPNALYVCTPSWWNEKLIKEALDIGVHQIVCKPFSIKTLSEILLLLIKSKKAIEIEQANPLKESFSKDGYSRSHLHDYEPAIYGRAV